VTRLDSQSGDSVAISLKFEGGSIGTVHYLANGSKAFPKERLEVFAAGRVLQLDNFRKLKGFGWPGFSTMNLWPLCKPWCKAVLHPFPSIRLWKWRG